jgi:hypothetical protein
MDKWKKVLRADPIDWLLEDDNPSVRYFTLVHLLDEPRDSAVVKKAKKEIMKKGAVPAILKSQNGKGAWEKDGIFYRHKYKGTVWQLLILAEMGADGGNAGIKKACEYIISHSQDVKSGGFSADAAAKGGGTHSYVIPCLTGNVLFSLIRLGLLNDKRVRRGIEWITKYQRFDDGAQKAPAGWPYDSFESCWGTHTCFMGAVKSLKALAEIPEKDRNTGVNKTIENGTEFMLKHHVYKKSHDLSKVSRPGWLKFGFPLMYQTDALEVLLILSALNCRDARMKDGIDLVVSKQDTQGRWMLENTFNGKFQVNIESKNRASKWITLNACRVLKSYLDMGQT